MPRRFGAEDIDLLLVLETPVLVTLARRVDQAEGAAKEDARAELERRTDAFAQLFELWRRSEGLEEGGTWPRPARPQGGR
jgi:hypothetical protein